MSPHKKSKATFALLTTASVLAFASPAAASDECGIARPGGGTVTCTPAGNPYPNGIFYIANDPLTIQLQGGVIVNSSGSLNPGVFAIATSATGGLSVQGATNTSITTSDSGAYGALVATNAGAINISLDRITTSGANAAGILGSSADGATTIRANNISTTGNSADGIDANTNNGAIGITSGSISTTGAGSVGINTRSDFANISVASTSITTTGGSGAIGILAATGGPATIGITSGTISTGGASATGIRATNNTGALSVTAANTNTTGANAEGISVVTGGTATINGGVVNTSGINSNGIQAQATNGANVSYSTVTTRGDNSVGVLVPAGFFFGPRQTATATISGGNVTTSGAASDGIRAIAATGAANTTVNGTVTTTGNSSNGIVLTGPTGVSLIGPVTVSTAGTSSTGIKLTSAGTITLADAGGTVTTAGANSNGVNAIGGTGANTLTVGAVRATGAGSLGINASTTTGAVSIAANGVTANADAIQAVSTSGNVTINALDDVTSTTGIGIDVATGGTALINVASGAPVRGQTTGINSVATGGSTLNLSAAVTGTTFAINLDGGASTVNNLAGGAVTGAINLTDANDVYTNTGTTTLTGVSDFGLGADLFTNTSAGILNLTAGSSVLGLETLNNNSLVNVAGTSTLMGTTFNNLATGILAADGTATLAGGVNFANAGTIDLQDGLPNDTLTITSNYVGSGGANLLIDVTPAAADRLVIGGSASGSTTVNVFGGGGPILNSAGLLVVDTNGSTANAFVLGANPSTALINYSLEQRGADYFLTSTATAAAFQPLTFGIIGQDLWYQSADSYLAMAAGRRGADVSRHNGFGIWADVYASRDRYGDNDNRYTVAGTNYTINDRVRNNRAGGQIGFDYAPGNGPFLVGATAGYERTKADLSASSADFSAEGYNIGAYAALAPATGFYAGLLAKYDSARMDLSNSVFGNDGAPKLKSMGFDGEVGFRFGTEAMAFDLNAGISHVRSKVEDFTSLGGFTYDFDKTTSNRGRLGVRAEFGGGLGAYVGAKLLHEFKGDSDVRFINGANGYNLTNEGRGTWGRFEAGLDGGNDGGVTAGLWSDIGDVKGVGVRAGFRF